MIKNKCNLLILQILLYIILLISCQSSHSGSEEVILYGEAIKLGIISPNENESVINEFSIKGTASSLNTIVEVKIYIDNNEYNAKASETWEGPYNNTNNTIKLLDPRLFNMGYHNLTVKATDSKGFSKSYSTHFIISSQLKIYILSHIKDQIISNSSPIIVAGYCEGLYQPFRKIEVWIDDENTKVEATIDTNLSWTATITPSNFSPGDHIINARIIDGYFVAPNTVTTQVFVKAIAGAITCHILAPVNESSVRGTISLIGNAFATRQPMTLDIQIDDNNWIPLAPQNSWEYLWDTTNFSVGYHVVTIRITDADGITAFDIKIYKIEPINIKFICPTDGSSVRKMLFVAGTCTSGNLIESIKLQLDGTDILPIAITPTYYYFWSTINSSSFNSNLHLPSDLTRGYHEIQVVAVDNIGNIAKDEIVVNVHDCNIAYIPSSNDELQNLFFELHYTSFLTAVTSSILTNSTSLNQYCVLIKNCGISEVSIDPIIINNIKNYVSKGNSFLCNHNELSYVTSCFPDFMTYSSTDGSCSPAYNGPVDIIEPALQTFLGGTTSINAYIDNYGFGFVNTNPIYRSTIWVSAPITYSSSPYYTPIEMINSFQYGAGVVCYTGFHAQNAGTDINQVLKFIIENTML